MHLIKTNMRDPVDNWIMHTSICLSRMVLRSMIDFFFGCRFFKSKQYWHGKRHIYLFFSFFFFVVISEFSLLSLHVAIYPVAALYVYKIELNDLNGII